MMWRQAALTAARAEAVAQIASLSRDFDGMVGASESSNSDDEHDPEGATIAFERAQVAAMLDQARLRLDDIDLALDRLRRGTHGICERCGERIADDRLAARPAARTCIHCASLS